MAGEAAGPEDPVTEVRPGVVFDCVVFVQALARRNGPAAACKELVDQGRATLFVSHAILAEVGEVLRRPKIQQKLLRLTPEGINVFLQDIDRRAITVADVPAQFTYPRDPKDEPYINLALAAGARYLVTWDHDMLDLMGDPDFRQRFPSLTILTPVLFLKEFVPGTGAPSGG